MIFPTKSTICIVGAGAIGGLLGVHLSLQGHEVSFFGRGAHLTAMQKADCLKLKTPQGETIQSAPGSKFVSNLSQLSPQDIVIIGLKMHQIESVLPQLSYILKSDTIIITTQNGIPWWYFQQYPGPVEYIDHTIESVDPGGRLKESIESHRILATVVYPAAHISNPGEITHVEGIRFPIGEPNGEETDRVKWVSKMLIQSGFKSPILSDIRGELWLKLWGTVAVNPLSALTHSTLDVLCTHPDGRKVVMNMMKEVEMVANKLGSNMRLPAERRVDGAAKVGKHRTSMLQDVETGKEMEIETIIGSVVELAELCQVNIPCIDTIYRTIRMLAHVMKEDKSKICSLPIDS